MSENKSQPTAAAPSAEAIEVDSLSKTYDTRNGRVTAVHDASFSVARGDFVALVGPSGCGKSTVLKIVAGLLDADRGDVTVLGEPVRAGNPAVGIMLQSPTLFPWRTVLKNVLLPTEIYGIEAVEAEKRARRILDTVGLRGFEEKHAWELSGGMQQRVSLSRLLIFEPSVLLMDEPFGALDEFTRERLNLEIAALHEQLGRTVLYVTHNITEALFLADRIVVMTNRPGRVLGVVRSELERPRTIEMIDSDVMLKQVREVRRMLKVDSLAVEPTATGA